MVLGSLKENEVGETLFAVQGDVAPRKVVLQVLAEDRLEVEHEVLEVPSIQHEESQALIGLLVPGADVRVGVLDESHSLEGDHERAGLEHRNVMDFRNFDFAVSLFFYFLLQLLQLVGVLAEVDLCLRHQLTQPHIVCFRRQH